MKKARAVVRGYFNRYGKCRFYFNEVSDDFYINSYDFSDATKDWVACYNPEIQFDGCVFKIRAYSDQDNVYWDIFGGVYMKIKTYDEYVVVNFAGRLYENDFIQESFTLPLSEYGNPQTVVFDIDMPVKIEFVVDFVSARRFEK